MIDEDVLSGRINRNKWPIWLIAIVAVATVLGLALRIAAANGDLWLDEFMSIAIVQGIPLSQVVLGLPVDNNRGWKPLFYALVRRFLRDAAIVYVALAQPCGVTRANFAF